MYDLHIKPSSNPITGHLPTHRQRMEYKMNIGLLSRAECNILRGLAIIGIFLHNYSHWLNPIVKENEYRFFRHNADLFNLVMSRPDHLLPLHIVSFFGHYGVPIFLFLSAYGLERKYGNPASAPAPIREGLREKLLFIRTHYLKLFRMMIVGFICFTFIDAITPGRWHYSVLQIVAQLGMFNNLLTEPDRNIWPGPYWFFGLMLQLYIVYRLLLYRRHWGWTVALMVLCTGIQFLFGPESEELNRYRYNFMGGMLPFGMGLLFARYGERIILVNLGTVATWFSLIVILGFIHSLSNSFWGWNFVPMLVCMAAVYAAKALKTLTSNVVGAALWKGLEWMGDISAALFVIHPVLRKVFIPISRQGDIYAGLLLYIIASLGTAWLVHRIINAGTSAGPSEKGVSKHPRQ